MVLVNIRIRDPASCNDVWVKSPNYDAWKHAGSSGAKGGIGKGKRGRRLLKAQGSEIQKRTLPGKRKEGDRKVMNKILKRLLSVVLAVMMVIGLVPLSRPVTVEAADFIPAGTTIYFDPSDSPTWSQAGIYGFESTAYSTEADLVIMEQVEGTNLYQGKLREQASNIRFYRIDPATGDTWNVQSTWPALETGKYLYKLNNNAENEWFNVTGYWQSYTPEDYTVSDNNLFYVNTDLVDYYNDARVDTGDTATFSTNNQGSWMGNFTEHDGTAFSYLNGKISSYLGNSNRENLPLYFGSLLFINNRVGRENLKGSEYKSLARWNTTANVALTKSDQQDSNVNTATHNTSAAVQGLVYNQLRSDGQLLAPDGNKELPYFSKNLANEWKYGNNSLMKYYEGYQFPFKVSTYENSEVKKYSYDSETDYAVRLSENSNEKRLVALDTPNKTKNTDGTNGYYPFNIVGESNRNNVNYGFGTKFTIPFTVNENGTIDGTESGKPITFSFTGDDDVWVFLDGHLVLDMGGAHAKAEGEIDFKNLTATVKNAATAENNSDQVVSGNSNDVSNYQNKGLDNYVWSDGSATQERSTVATSNSEKTFSQLVNDDFAKSFKDSSQTHTLVMFYMERGMYDSNMKVEFTINPLPSGLSLSKSLDVTDVNDGLVSAVQEAEDDSFSFKIQTKESGSEGSFENVDNLGYTLTKGNKDSELQTAQDSVISGVGAKSYAHSFINTISEDNAFTSGTSFEITELTENTGTVFEYDYNNTTWTVYDKDANNSIIASSANSDMNNLVAKFDFPDTGDFIKYDYGVNFTNKPKVGSVSVTKQWENGETAPADGEYSFKILVDLDGEENDDYNYLPYELDYTLAGDTKSTDADGNFTLKIGDTVTFAGIPVGASYKIVESIPENANYTSDQMDNTVTDTINNSAASVTFTNSFNTKELDKVIYIEAGREDGTNYTVKDSDNATITITDIKPAEGITVVKDDNGTVNFKSDNADKKYEVTYSGTKTDGTIVTGKITVFTYKATNKVYVFDYGLESDLTETNDNGDGLFQGGVFYNVEAQSDDATKTTAVLDGITDDGDTPQTDVVADAAGVTINQDGTSAGKVTFKPQAFMDQAENYAYTADITKTGTTLDKTNPETGTVVNGKIKVMPADVVYYEDNFASDTGGGINFMISGNEGVSQVNTGKIDRTQSNDQSENYGHEDNYSEDIGFSNGSATVLTNGDTATFTFTGTGFDIISRTNSKTAGIGVEVYKGASINKDDRITTRYVDTYYSNGDLYQVPVITVEDLSEIPQQYTVKLSILGTYTGQTTVYIDGIRIYNPLSDKSDYIETEKEDTIKEIRDMLFGANYDPEKPNIQGNSTIDLVEQIGNEYLLGIGSTVIEAYNDENGYESSSVESLENVLASGPNNELYVPIETGVAFQVNKPGANDWTLQIGAKNVAPDEDTSNTKKLYVFARPHTYTENATFYLIQTIELKSSTDMYYDIDLTSAIEEKSWNAENYDVMLWNYVGEEDSVADQEFISLTNLKYGKSTTVERVGLGMTTLMKVSLEGQGELENAKNIIEAKFNVSSVTRGKNVSMTITTTSDVEDVIVYDPDGEKVSNPKKTHSTDANGNLVWTVSFKAYKTKTSSAEYTVDAVVNGIETGNKVSANIRIK